MSESSQPPATQVPAGKTDWALQRRQAARGGGTSRLGGRTYIQADADGGPDGTLVPWQVLHEEAPSAHKDDDAATYVKAHEPNHSEMWYPVGASGAASIWPVSCLAGATVSCLADDDSDESEEEEEEEEMEEEREGEDEDEDEDDDDEDKAERKAKFEMNRMEIKLKRKAGLRERKRRRKRKTSHLLGRERG